MKIKKRKIKNQRLILLLLFSCLLALMLPPISFAVAEPIRTEKANVISTAIFEMEWNKTIGGAEEEYANSLIQTADGGFILVGDTYSYGAGEKDAWLVKTDANGQLEWNKTFGGTSWDYEVRAVQTADGGIVLGGSTSSYGAGDSDFWLVKTDASGQAEWNKTFGGAEGDFASSLIQTADGGYALAGSTHLYRVDDDDFDFWLVKTDASGQAEWNKTFGGENDDVANSMIQTADGGYVLAGSTGDDIWLIKLNESEITTTTTTTTTVDGGPGFELEVLILSLTLFFLFARKRRS
jgi:hypothetical protein